MTAKCTLLRVLIVARRPRFRSNRAATDRFTAEIATTNAEQREVQDGTFADNTTPRQSIDWRGLFLLESRHGYSGLRRTFRESEDLRREEQRYCIARTYPVP